MDCWHDIGRRLGPSDFVPKEGKIREEPPGRNRTDLGAGACPGRLVILSRTLTWSSTNLPASIPLGAWNSSEMGAVIKQFGQTYGSTDNAWIVPYPYWVDTRLPGVWAGIPNRDFAIWPENFNSTLDVQGPKLFIVNVQDMAAMDQLKALYPHGVWSRFVSKTKLEGKDFMIFFVPPAAIIEVL